MKFRTASAILTPPAALFLVALMALTFLPSPAARAAGEITPAIAATADTDAIPPIDSMQSLLMDVTQIVHMPSLHNFHDMAVCTPDMLGVNYAPGGMLWAGSGPRWMRYNTIPPAQMFINDTCPEAQLCRWFPYQAVRLYRNDTLLVETTTRLLFEGRGIMYQILLSNQGAKDKTYNLAIRFPFDETTTTLRQEPLAAFYDWPSRLAMAYAFPDPPDKLDPLDNAINARWKLKIRAGGKAQIRLLMAVGNDIPQARAEALRLGRAFTEFWNQARQRWADRWRQAFTPGNTHFSGNAPLLVTSNGKLSEIYYRSILTLLLLERTNLAKSDRVFITSGERQKGCVFFWDTSLFSTLFALLEPRAMRDQLALFLQCDPHKGCVYMMDQGKQDFAWYAANDYTLFKLAWGYLGVTGDLAFLDRPLGGQTAQARIENLATGWKKLLDAPGDALADYGEMQNLLECVPTYIHKVPSFNAANVWMMRALAGLLERRGGEEAKAAALREQAARIARAVLSLYVPGQGVWCSLHRDGRRVEMRHCYDFVTVGSCLREDLPPATKKEMLDFVRRELLTYNWMRAQSLDDPAAEHSDRPDHGPLGAYDAWPALTAATMCELGDWPHALAFLNQTHGALSEGVYAQAHELYGPKRFELSAAVRIAQRGACMRECSGGGAFAEMIITTLFGYRPEPGPAGVQLFAPEAPRGFEGQLRHVRHGNEYYTITSGPRGLTMEKETAPGLQAK